MILILCPKLVTDLSTQPRCTVFCEITQGKLITGNRRQYCQELPLMQQLAFITAKLKADFGLNCNNNAWPGSGIPASLFQPVLIKGVNGYMKNEASSNYLR